MFQQDDQKATLYIEDGKYVEHVSKTFMQKAVSVVSAVLTGQKVAPEVARAREAICATCPYAANPGTPNAMCKICGCSTKIKSSYNILGGLVEYEETDQYGCFFYSEQRKVKLPVAERSKWAEAGL
jgi:hypothetical protein